MDCSEPTEKQSYYATLMYNENAHDLIKSEPALEDFEFENMPLAFPKQLSAEKCIYQDPKLIICLENRKVIEKDGKFIVENQHQSINGILAR